MTVSRVQLLDSTVLPFSPSETDASPLRALTSGLARGDDAAWAKFHRDYGPTIFRHLLAATRGDHDLASEALQQTYLRVARHARPCDAEPMFAGWLRVVSRSALNDLRRRRRTFWELLNRRHADPSDATVETPASVDTAESAADDRMLSALDAALAEIDADDRALLEAKYFSGLDVRALADQRAITPKAAESRLTRARAQLRERLRIHLSRHE